MTIETKIDLLMRMQICQMDKAARFCDECPYAQAGKPCEPSCRTNLIADAVKALNGRDQKEQEEHRIRDTVEDILLDIGVPVHGKGYPFLVEIITQIVSHPEVAHEKIYVLYGIVAKKFDTVERIVERNIRSAIERAAYRHSDKTEKYFSSSIHPDRGYPTNREFIYRIVSVVQRDLWERTQK